MHWPESYVLHSRNCIVSFVLFAMHFLVDSAQRTSGDTTEYEFQLQSEIRNVRGIRLLQAVVPKSVSPTSGDSIILDLGFSTDTGTLAVNIETPMYTGADLAAVLREFVHTFTGQNTAQVLFDYDYETRGRLIILAAATTTLNTIQFGNEFTARLFGGDYNGGASTATGGVLNYVFPFVIDLSWPNYLLCDLDFGYGISSSLATDGGKHSLVVPMIGNYADVIDFTASQNFQQLDTLPNVSILKVKVKWRPPERYSNPLFEGSLYFKDHTLLFEAF